MNQRIDSNGISHRQPGQGGEADGPRDLRAELLAAEAAHFAKKAGIDTGKKPTDESFPSLEAPVPKRQLIEGRDESEEKEEDPEAKRRRILEESRELDAESEDSDSSEDESDSDDEEDETAELMRELEKIKKERAEQREKEVRLFKLELELEFEFHPVPLTLIATISLIINFSGTRKSCKGTRRSRIRDSKRKSSAQPTRLQHKAKMG